MEGKQSPKQEPSEREILIYVHLQTSHTPPVFDLSLTQPLEIFFEIKRGIVGEEDPRPLTLLTTGSTFDGACAISSGSIQLIDREDDAVIDLKNIDKTNWPSKANRLGSPSPNESFVTLAPRARTFPPVKGVRKKFEHELPLGLPVNVRNHLKAGHKYRLWLAIRDLNIRWWAWGSASELGITSATTLENLTAYAAGKIVAAGHTHIDFSVVTSFPIPPALKIQLLPAPPRLLSPASTIATPEGDERDGGERKEEEQQEQQQQQQQKQQQAAIITEARVLVTVTNIGTQTISVKSNFQQHYIRPRDDEYPHGLINSCTRITSTSRPPSLMNFSLMDVSWTGDEELSPGRASNSGPANGHASRANFTTLQPGVAVSNVVEFPERVADLMRGRRCVLSLRPFGVAWVEGAVEDLFARAEASGERGLWMLFTTALRPPLMLECADRLLYELPALDLDISGGGGGGGEEVMLKGMDG